MTAKKIIDAGKQPDKSQEKFAEEHLSDNNLDNVAGGTGGTSEPVYLDEPPSEPIYFEGGK